MTSPAPRPPSIANATARRARPARGRDRGYWPAVAIIAIMVATAGWTTVAVMALNSDNGGGAAAPGRRRSTRRRRTHSLDDSGAGRQRRAGRRSHDAPDLEALLPTAIGDTAMSLQSWTGDGLLSDGGAWATRSPRTSATVGKTTGRPERGPGVRRDRGHGHSVGVFRLDGVADRVLPGRDGRRLEGRATRT